MSARHCPPRGRAPASSALVALAAFLASATLQACRSMAPPHAPAHPFDDAALLAALSAEPRLEPFLANAEGLRLKLELAEVVAGAGGRPVLRRSRFVAAPEYGYPASTIKTCAVVAALQKLAALSEEHGLPFDRDSRIEFAPLFDGETRRTEDLSNLDGAHITVGHLARKVLLPFHVMAYRPL